MYDYTGKFKRYFIREREKVSCTLLQLKTLLKLNLCLLCDDLNSTHSAHIFLLCAVHTSHQMLWCEYCVLSNECKWRQKGLNFHLAATHCRQTPSYAHVRTFLDWHRCTPTISIILFLCCKGFFLRLCSTLWRFGLCRLSNESEHSQFAINMKQFSILCL